MIHQLVGDELRLDGIGCHVTFNEIRHGRPCEVGERIIDSGSLGNLFNGDRVGFISGNEVRVFDPSGCRPTGPTDLPTSHRLVNGNSGIATCLVPSVERVLGPLINHIRSVM